MKKVLFIGGTGTISSACAELAISRGFDLTVLNRGNGPEPPSEVRRITADMNDEAAVAEIIKDMDFDVVADFILFKPEQAERDIRLFAGKTRQFIFISSASAYQKPLSYAVITESTPLYNPYWQYSRDKIAIEERFIKEYRDNGFPITIVRPSHTYGDKSIPVCQHGAKGSYQVVKRILDGKPIIVPGDGTTWWTLTHNSDFAKGFVGLMGNVHAIGEAFHITSGESLTWNTIHDIIGGVLGKRVITAHVSTDMLCKFEPSWEGGLTGDKCASVRFDNSKLKRIVPEYIATTRFDQGAARTLEFMLSHPECQVPDPEFDALCDRIIAAVDRFGAE
ncbi:MAG: SDR family oxidoreductase [Clostridiales bacterium]|jgi:nucleoside-diphosphate-sugar epimerase|nr:SDR family oxidoreductase [Clostridiales bacterium]